MKKTYSALRDQLGTGDIVLFSGRGVFSWLIKRATRSQWSHVGMVVRDPDLDLLLLCESGGGWKKDEYSGKRVFGVRFVQLSEAVRTYCGKVAIRPLLDIELTDADYVTIGKAREELDGRPYQRSILELIGAAVDCVDWIKRPNLKSLFCSEMVAEMYQRLDLLSPPPVGWPSNEYTPEDFAQITFLRRNARLGPVVEVAR